MQNIDVVSISSWLYSVQWRQVTARSWTCFDRARDTVVLSSYHNIYYCHVCRWLAMADKQRAQLSLCSILSVFLCVQ